MTPDAGAPVVREARPQDLPRLAALLRELAQGGEHPELEPPDLAPAQEAALRALSEDPRARVLVLEAGGQVAGTLTVYVLANLSHGGRPFALVENVVVAEGTRGRGYGALLLERAVALAREAGCYKLTLTSNRRREAAHRFYEGLGLAHTHRGYTLYFTD